MRRLCPDQESIGGLWRFAAYSRGRGLVEAPPPDSCYRHRTAGQGSADECGSWWLGLVLDGIVDERRRRHAAREFYRAAPPFCIRFAAELCIKQYEYWPNKEPEDATTWKVISTHANLEEAERRLKTIIGGPVYYDADGSVARKPPRRKPLWDMPPLDDD
jgi:hypothetical protein